MTATVAPEPRRTIAEPLASPWHTAAFIGAFLLLAAAGALFQGTAPSHPGRLQQHPPVAALYLSLILMEWALVFWISRGVRRSGTRLRDLIGGRWSSPKSVALDVLLALVIWAVWTGGQLAWDRALGPGHAASIGALGPQQPAEVLLWIALSMSAGFCEELAFRGYLQTQLQALTGSGVAAILLQALVFGVSHGYQGVDAAIKIAAYGAVYGVVAMWRRSLRPGMLAHAWSDIFSGLLVR